MAELLVLDALVSAEDGRPGDAARSIASAVLAGRSLKDCPSIFAALRRLLCELHTVQALERVMTVARLDDAQLARLADVFGPDRADNGLVRATVGDRCRWIRGFQDPAYMWAGMDGVYRWHVWHWGYQVAGLMEKSHVLFLDISEKWIQAARLPLPQRIAAFKAVDDELQLAKDGWNPGLRLLDVEVPAFGPSCVQDAWVVAMMRSARAAIAVEGFRLKTGKLPEGLAQLVPGFIKAIPADPFDGKPLRYKKLPKGYVVYSIGDNGKDDGGLAETDGYGLQVNVDVTFTVTR